MPKFQVIVQNQEDPVFTSMAAMKESALFDICEAMIKANHHAQLADTIKWKLLFGKYDQAVALLEKEGFTVTIKELDQ